MYLYLTAREQKYFYKENELAVKSKLVFRMEKSIFIFKKSFWDLFAKTGKGWDAEQKEKRDCTACVEKEIVNITGADHQKILQAFYGGNRENDDGNKPIPAFSLWENPRQEKRQRHKSAKIAE